MKTDSTPRFARSPRSDATSFTVHDRFYQNSPSVPKTSQPAGQKGFVFLVGAGPSDPDLLTVKAVKVLQHADVVVYDRLVGRDILELANPDAQMVYVGKRCGQPSMKQEAISALLVDFAQQGKQVVRLKGGDPFIFGRGGEEALALVKHNIAYQVVPGITAAIGCASSALIPLTHREVSRSVTLITGQVVTGALPAWAGLVSSGQTLVFYMGLEKADAIEQGLMSAGLSGSTPVAVVGQGCSEQQTVVTFELNQLTQTANALKGLSPALIIMGDVVKLREQLMQTAHAVTQSHSQPARAPAY
ncbi:uroporphyrinogen-III C-methyltransferase [Vibrio fluvialis]|uniref:uroporphyrinogen-III C-methyltransferase n=1 Tax=Vibrio fluvialis TaxID=676 RepID=UPI001C9C26EC|nr:uroporphyrinogen-III C-methyltransferase [Vibrio fluvialis]MBY7767474.1 uroporphyrinogen-III C-methyltransferase [Vibrio fluvialis]MCE7597710.1 uroporphyrinogen-III C-methyltransferase [Vibrio fluvialis]